MTRTLALLHFVVPTFLVPTALVSGCATMERTSSFPEPHASAHIELRPTRTANDDANAVAPRLVGDADLPSARSLKTQLLANSDQYELGVRICVHAAGDVAGIELTRSSGDVALDNAALHDIRAWQYERMPGPATLQTCSPISIHYQP